MDKHKTWLTTNFLGINNERRYIFSYQYSLFKGYSNDYYAAYIQYEGTDNNGKDYSISYTLTKFKFNSFDSYEKTTKEFWNNYDNRIVSAFIMSEYSTLVVFFLKSGPASYHLRTHSLSDLKQDKEVELYKIANNEGNDNANPGDGIFFKALYLRYQYVAFIFFTDKDNGKSLILIIYYFNADFSFSERIKKYINGYNLDTDITTNEFYKIDYQNLLYISTVSKTKLIIMFFDTRDWYNYLNTRTYKFDMTGYYSNKEFSIDYFNDFLMFTSTVSPNGGSSLSSILMFFSYPNGTDFYINISPYVTDSEYYQSGYNLIDYLLKNIYTIENNIFGYSRIEKVKLTEIPDELLFYRTGNSTAIASGEEINKDNILKQNKDLIKYDRNYTLEWL